MCACTHGYADKCVHAHTGTQTRVEMEYRNRVKTKKKKMKNKDKAPQKNLNKRDCFSFKNTVIGIGEMAQV